MSKAGHPGKRYSSALEQRLHGVVLDVYKVFGSICEKHDLRHFGFSGTSLGAKYWQGFIPWDDDMDIAMPADDYLQFAKVVKDENLGDYAFSEYIWFGGKLHDTRTTFVNIYHAADLNRYNGAFIDIVPLIALPDDSEERCRFVDDIKHFQKAGMIWDRYGELWGGFSSVGELYHLRDKILHSYKFGETKFIMDLSDPRYTLETKGFLEAKMMPFEDVLIPVSSNLNNDLKIQYKNFKKLPPEEVRRSAHEQFGLLDLDTPFSEYTDRFKKIEEPALRLFRAKHSYECLTTKQLFESQDYIAELEQGIKHLNQINKALEDELSRRTKDIDLIYQSESYRLGNRIVKPLVSLKNLVHAGRRNSKK